MIGPIAQKIEHLASNQKVEGASPSGVISGLSLNGIAPALRAGIIMVRFHSGPCDID